MGKTKEILEKIKKGWQGLSKGKKWALGIILIALLLSVIIYYFVFGRTKYVPVFTHLDIQDSAKIVKKLEEMKIDKYKIEEGGGTILVPEKDVDRLRLDLAIDGALPNNGKGFEIFDDTSFAITDEDRKIMYQRALEGELQRSIMSLEEVDYARIHLVMGEETIFTKEVKPGSASVVLKLNPLKELKPEQVKGIISLISGAVKNIPEENVRVLDTESNLLSDGILDKDDSLQGAEQMNKRIEVKKQFERNLEKDLKDMLEQTLGTGKVIVKVAANLDFNSKETTTISYDKEGTILSQQKKLDRTDNLGQSVGESPIDNNVGNSDDTQIYSDPNVNSYENVTNYQVGETKTHIINAPGEITNISASVVYDGDLTPNMQTAVENIVKTAIGFNQARGDMVSVEGMEFDNSYQEKLQEEMEKDQEENLLEKEKQKKLFMFIGIGTGAFILLLLISLGIMKIIEKRKEKREEEAFDVIVDEPISIKEVMEESMEQIAAGNESQEEKIIKRFAEQSPEKVAELIKAWILEDER